MTLGILEALQERGAIPKLGDKSNGSYQHNSPEYLHAIIESLRIAFSDGHWWISDPEYNKDHADSLLSKEYLMERSKLFSPDKASEGLEHGSPAFMSCDTVYFSVVDKEGNGCSFIKFATYPQ